MKLQLATALTFLTLALAMPAPEAEPENPMPVPIANPIKNENEPRNIRPAALGLEKRARVSCKIVNTDSTAVNCRYKPSLSSSVIARIPRGSTHTFYCYKRGDCYNGNWLVLPSPFSCRCLSVMLDGWLTVVVPGIKCFTKSKSVISMDITLIAAALLVSSPVRQLATWALVSVLIVDLRGSWGVLGGALDLDIYIYIMLGSWTWQARIIKPKSKTKER